MKKKGKRVAEKIKKLQQKLKNLVYRDRLTFSEVEIFIKELQMKTSVGQDP